MSDLLIDWVLVPSAFLLLFASWLLMGRFYKLIYGVPAKWWAIPFTHGAILWARRLPRNWEKHS